MSLLDLFLLACIVGLIALAAYLIAPLLNVRPLWLGLGIGVVLYGLLQLWRLARPPECQIKHGFRRVSRWVACSRDGSIEIEFGNGREGHIVYSNRAKAREARIAYDTGRRGRIVCLTAFDPIPAEPISDSERQVIGEHIRAAAWVLGLRLDSID